MLGFVLGATKHSLPHRGRQSGMFAMHETPPAEPTGLRRPAFTICCGGLLCTLAGMVLYVRDSRHGAVTLTQHRPQSSDHFALCHPPIACCVNCIAACAWLSSIRRVHLTTYVLCLVCTHDGLLVTYCSGTSSTSSLLCCACFLNKQMPKGKLGSSLSFS